MARYLLTLLSLLALTGATMATPLASTTTTQVTVTTVTVTKDANQTTVPAKTTTASLAKRVPPKVNRFTLMRAETRAIVKTNSPIFFSRFWNNSRAERYFVNLLLASGGQSYTLFLPTDAAYLKFARSGSASPCKAGSRATTCVRQPLDNLLAQQMVPLYLTARALRRLNPGDKIPTVTAVYLTVKQTKVPYQLGISTGLNQFLSYANVITADRTAKNSVIHFMDGILTAC